MTTYTVGPVQVPRRPPTRRAAPRRSPLRLRFPRSPRRPSRRSAFGAALIGVAAAASACGDAGVRNLPAPTPEYAPVPSRETFPPAVPGSGQPFLASAASGVWMSWTEPAPDGGHRVAAAYFDGGESRWGAPVTIAQGRDFFVNWADFPSVRLFGELLVAHWLQRGGGGGTYDYGVRLAWSRDKGATWSEPWTPHEDDTPTEHGFATVFHAEARAGDGGRVWAAWLDGRAMTAPGGAMALRARTLPAPVGGASAKNSLPFGSAGVPGPVARPGSEELLDARTCECCQTGAVVVDGVPVVAYRDRGRDELRNVHVVRRLPDGWTASRPVHDDGWVVGGCPVNGPAVAARDGRVVVAWFTAPKGEARVNVAFSADGAATFEPPLRVDGGLPSGRTDVVMLDDGSALVAWLERQEGGGAVVASRRVAPNGASGALRTLAASSEGRASGFPRIARLGTDRLVLAWTDVADEHSQVRVDVFDLDAWGASP